MRNRIEFWLLHCYSSFNNREEINRNIIKQNNKLHSTIYSLILKLPVLEYAFIISSLFNKVYIIIYSFRDV